MAYVHKIRKTLKGIVSYCAKRNEQIVKLRQKGWSFVEIAEKYNMTPQRAGQIIREMQRANRRNVKKAS